MKAATPILSAVAVALVACGAPEAKVRETAQDGPRTLAEATAGPSNVALFKTGDDDTTVYMLGTVHILHPDISWETPAIQQAWNEADTVFFEVDITSPDALAEVGALFLERGFDASGKTLADYYDASEKKTINDALTPLGLNLAAFNNMRPWYASVNITQVALMNIGGQAEAGLEMILGKRAADDGKTMRYFESLLQQVEFISAGTDEEQADLLLAGVDELTDLEASFARMIGAWYDGEPEKLANIISEAFEEVPAMAEILLYNRNEDWAQQLDQVIRTEPGTFFVAVGAGHLGGPNSVQDYLSERGYTVTRVTAD
ncbi:TraB/GumN family protein [Parvularcula sp. LCG005]|uniref:TraB/GumN family protein n=1 Tax=Parvularcula sp. LCG005 TaxID=3078805 RepID=UPI002943B6BA|nr:TraB/GumN family protein [Parvularcula sp. LCG005]WOI53244.1 TraB/GumN family protein [Parvularcula sp. LCG005]